MFKQRNKSEQNNSGAIMLESLIVYPVTMFLLFFILAIFSVLYQRWNLQIVANDAVMRVAQTYRLETADEMTGYVTSDDLNDVGRYRYVTNVLSHNMEESADTRADSYAGWRLSKSTYTKSTAEPNCKVTVHSDSLGRRHLQLVLTGSYSVPFGEFLAYFGFDSIITYEVTAYADTLDLIDYMNTVDYVETQTSLDIFDSKLVGFIDSIFKLFNNLFES